jgi:hypothetical protein
MIDFAKYAKIKDRYCLCYFGYSDEYLLLLKHVQPLLERKFPGIQLTFGCKDDKADIFSDCPSILKLSEIKIRREEFGHVRELRFNGKTHPIEDLLDECDIPDWSLVGEPTDVHTRKCVIVTRGNYPTKDLERHQLEILKRLAKEKGYEAEIDADIRAAGLVMGVESMSLFKAAASNIRTKLLPTGIGTRLYRKLFPFGEVLHT